MHKSSRYRAMQHVTIVGAITNLLMAVAKVLLGLYGRSQALFADGIHSFSDLLSDILVVVAARFGSQAADSDHPYGHRRIETVGTVALALLLIFAGIGIIWDALHHLMMIHQEPTPAWYVAVVAAVSVLLNEWLYRYTLKTARRIESQLLHANAWHSRSDAISSIVVLVGVLGSMLGWLYLDEVAAMVVGILVIKMGWDFAWKSLRELVDTGVEPEQLQTIIDIANSVAGVRALHQLRTRSHGGKVFVDLHIIVDPYISVSEGHHIGEQVELELISKVAAVDDVTVHIDPEDDERTMPSSGLPSRQDLLKLLHARWRGLPAYSQLESIRLHYLAGSVDIELYFKPDASKLQAQDWFTPYRSGITDLRYVRALHVYMVAETAS